MAKHAAVVLEHIGEAIENIRADTSNLDEADFLADRRSRQLVERNLEIISEASRHLPDALTSRYPDIPWRSIRDLGNVLRHDYDGLNHALLWKTVQTRLDPLAAAVAEMLAETERR